MRRGALLTLLALLVAAPFVAWLFLRIGLFTPVVNLALGREFPGGGGLQVRVGSLRSDVFHFIEADDVVVLASVQGAKIPLLTLSNLRLEFEFVQALRGRLDWQESLRLARLHGLKLFLLRESGGDWNLSPLRGLGGRKRTPKPRGQLPILPASRIELEDSEVVVNDEQRGFRATVDRIQGSLDTRALPLLAFTLNGRTDGHAKENLSLAGEWNQRDTSVYGRLNLEGVELARYLNYFLPVRGLRFTSGTASLSVRLRKAAAGELEASGRAEVDGGTLTLPGIEDPVSQLNGVVVFDPASLRFKSARARFLGSDWVASGAILDLRHPRFDLAVHNDSVPLAALSEQVRGMGLLALTGTAAVSATLAGPAKSPEVDAVLAVPWMGITGVELSAVSATAHLKGRHLDISRLSGGLWGGHLVGNAAMELGKDGDLRADLSVGGARLEQARLHGRRPLPFDGTAHLHVVATGKLKSPVLALDLDVVEPRMGGLELGGLNLHADLSPQGMKSSFASPKGRLSGTVAFTRGPNAAFHDTRITLKQVDLSATAQGLGNASETLALPEAALAVIAKMPKHVGGLMDAELSVEGPLRSPAVWMRMDLPQGKLFLGGGALALTAPAQGLDFRMNGTLGFHNGDLLLGRDLTPMKVFVGPRHGALELQALGRYPLKSGGQPGHMALALDADMKLLDAFKLFSKSQGHFSSDLVVGGLGSAPVVQGDLKLVNFATEPAHYFAPVKNGHLTVLFRGQTIQVADLGFESGGAVKASGNLDLSAGYEGMRGELVLETDDTGLRLQNWEGMGSGSLLLAPLDVSLDGEGQPLSVKGRVLLKDALIVYGGHAGGAEAASAPASASATAAAKRPLSLDLQVGLGTNVWYEKHQNKTLDLSDPRQWISGALESAKETLLQPDISFRLAPTQHDFIIRGTTPSLELLGELSVDRGRMTIMENDFQITNDKGPALIRFNGQSAEVSATAQARMHYLRDVLNPQTGQLRPAQIPVVVYVMISPRSQEEIEEAGLEGQFLNYKVDFDSEPPFVLDNPDLQRTACVDMVVLGDPMVDAGSQGLAGSVGTSGSGASDQGAQVATQGLGTVASGFVRKELAEFMRKLNFMGKNWIDVARVTPRISYQTGAGASQAAPSGAAATAIQGGQTSGPTFDWTVELGKSIGDSAYTSLQFLTFSDATRQGVVSSMNQATQATGIGPNAANAQNNYVQSYGLRTGLEYQVSQYRTFEVYGNFGCDDTLNPVESNSQKPFLSPNLSGVVQLRNTVPTDTYCDALARRRRWETATEGKP